MLQNKFRNYISAFLSCCFFYSSAQTADTALINKLNERSFKLVKKFPDSAVVLAQEAIALSEKINYYIGLGDGYIRLGLVEKDMGNYDKALAFYRKSLTFRLQMGNEDLIARVYNNMGMAFTWKAQYDSAVHYLVMALKIAERLQIKSYQATYLMNLGIAYVNNKDYEKAIQYNYQAKELYNQEEDSAGILKASVNLGSIYYEKGDYRLSLPLSREALQFAVLLEDDRNKFIAIGNIAVAYQGLNQLDSALYYMRQSLGYKNEIEDKRGVALDMNNMGMVFKELERSDSSTYYLSESLKLAEEIGEINLASRNAEVLAETFSKKGDYKKAFEYQQKFSTYRDSVFNESKAKAIAEMQTRYETEKKEKEIQLLNKDNEIKGLAIKKQSVLRNSLIGGTILIIIIGLLLFNRYRISEKNKHQAERMRISSDLHDEIGSTLSSISMYSSYAKEKPSATENILEEISSSSREMIDDMNDIIWAINPRNDSFEKTVERLHNYASRIAQSKNIVLDFRSGNAPHDVPLSMEQRKNLYLICKEAINNAVKYSGCKNLIVTFEKNKKHLFAEMGDDGKGFDTDGSYDGNGLKNMKQRSADMHAQLSVSSGAGSGTKIKLQMKLV
jgi:signal transduction histidine kinase